MTVSKRLRYEIMRRDNHSCRYCGGAAPDVKLTIDHVVPVTLGGQDEPSNLVTACADCNAGKSSAPASASTVAAVKEDALRWSKAMQEAAQRVETGDRERRDIVENFGVVWESELAGFNGRETRAADWRTTLNRFLDGGLPPTALLDALDITVGRNIAAADRWKYFCGVCWRKLDQIREVALTIVGEPR